MSELLALDVHEAPRLAQTLSVWPSAINEVRVLVSQAQTLCGIPVEVDLQLDEIAHNGGSLSMAIYHAVNVAIGYQLAVAPLELAPKTPVSNAQVHDVAALIEQIKQLGGSGQDPAAAFAALQSQGVSPSAQSFLLKGHDVRVVLEHFADGDDAAFGRVADAMAQGLSPLEAGIAAIFFPAEYTAWHEAQAEIIKLEAAIDLTERTVQAMFYGEVPEHPEVLAELTQVLEWVLANTPSPSLIEALLYVLAGGHVTRVPEQDRLALIALVELQSAGAQPRLDELRAEQSLLAVPTLDGMAGIGSAGSLQPFDAIGVAATTVPQVPSSFVGGSYAAGAMALSIEELGRATEFLASDMEAATTFFGDLGASAAGALLNDLYRRELGTVQAATLVSGDFAVNLSKALGLASPNLSDQFAIEIIESRPGDVVLSGFEVGPEYLFAYGEFDPGFLVTAAATSLERDQHQVQLPVNSVQAPIVGAVERAGLGAELVLSLEERGAVGALLFLPASAASTAGILGQASQNSTASKAVITAASTADDLNADDLAAAMSQLLAANVGEYIGAPADSPFFAVAEMVFAEGQGFELDIAVRAHLEYTTMTGFEIGNELWWHGLDEIGTFVAHVDASKHRVLLANADQLDQQADDQAFLVTAGLTLASIGVTAAGVFPAVAASTTVGRVLAVSGVGISGLGWLQPMFTDPVEHGLAAERSSYQHALGVDERGEAIVLWSALTVGAVEPPLGTGVQVTGLDLDVPSIIVTNEPAGSSVAIEVNADGAWVDQLLDVLPENETMVQLSGNQTAPLSDAMNIVGDQLLSDAYLDAFVAAAGLYDR